MANDNHANYAKVGLALVLGVVAIVGSLIYFGGIGNSQNEFLCETYYDHPVSGLSVGSEVDFRGVKIGQVRQISFVAAEYDRYADKDAQIIVIRMALDRHLCHLDDSESGETLLSRLIAKGLRATVSSSGITGLSRLDLNLPRQGVDPAPIPVLSWKPDQPWIPSEPSILENFADSLMFVMNRLKGVDFTVAWSNMASVAESAASIAGNANAILESQQGNVDEIMSNMRAASQSLREFSEEVKENPSLLLRANDAPPLPETTE